MSYDIALGVHVRNPKTGRENWYEIIEIGNMTSNVSGMWRLASPETDGLAGLDGMLAEQAVGPLSQAVLKMRADPDAYLLMEPSNGWGSYDGAMEFMSRVLKFCRQHPGLTISVDV